MIIVLKLIIAKIDRFDRTKVLHFPNNILLTYDFNKITLIFSTKQLK